MDATAILREQLKTTHTILEGALADLPDEHWHHCGDGSTISSIATIYTHIVMGEDWLVNSFAREQPSILQRDGWEAKTGLAWGLSNEEMRLAAREADFDAFRAYAQQVYGETDAYLASLSADDLDRVVTFGPLGDMPLGTFLANIVSWHAAEHCGEICALKGCLGGQGLPF